MLRRASVALIAALAGGALSACGGGSNQATSLLRQTFTGQHRISSGNLGLSLTIAPSGTSALKGPITLSLGGPFQSLGKGRLPQSNFSLSLGTSGGKLGVAILSTGSKGYVTFQGQSYELPGATFRRLESSFAQLGSSPGSRSGSGALAKLGIQPEHWLVKPRVVGNEALAGTNTTHIRAGIDVPALLGDLNTFLKRASSVGVSGASSLPGGLSAATRSRIASEIRNASIDVWTGTADKTLRRLDLRLTLDLTGQAATLLGSNAGLELKLDYAQLNQPQTISAPATVLPYSQFQAKLKVLLADLEGSLSSGLSAAGSGSSSGGTSSNDQKYTQCIEAAGSNVAKMQKCAPLLGGG
jgi:hypothetical protein